MLLRMLGTAQTHLREHMTIDIKRKRGRGVSHIFLHGFDVISALDRGDGVGMAQIMKSGFRCPDPLYDALEAVIYGAVC